MGFRPSAIGCQLSAFEAEGLLGGSAPVARGEEAAGVEPAVDARGRAGTQVQASPASAAPPPASATDSLAQEVPVAEAGLAEHAHLILSERPDGQEQSAGTPPNPSFVASAPMPVTASRNASGRALRLQMAARAPAPTPRPRADLRASALKVAIDGDGAGVAVSVIGAPLDAGQQSTLHRAVTRLLARHGLVLRALRVARRQGGQEGER